MTYMHKKDRQPKKENPNIHEYKAIKALNNTQDIIIKTNVTESAIVTMDKADYISEGYKISNNPQFYESTGKDLTG